MGFSTTSPLPILITEADSPAMRISIRRRHVDQSCREVNAVRPNDEISGERQERQKEAFYYEIRVHLTTLNINLVKEQPLRHMRRLSRSF
jgi:hypothetical protein